MKTQTKIMIQDTISGNGQRWDRKKNAALTDCALNKRGHKATNGGKNTAKWNDRPPSGHAGEMDRGLLGGG